MKILAMVNAQALAHVSRALEVARELVKDGHQLLFAGAGEYLKVASQEGFPTRTLPYASPEAVRNATYNGDFSKLFPAQALREWIEAERSVCRDWGAEAILTDNRSTAMTTAELERIPCIAITNLHMTRYRRIPFVTPRRARAEGLSEFFLGPLEWAENRLEFLLYDRVAFKGLAQLRKAWGLPARTGQTIEEGHLTLLADAPEFSPAHPLPEHVHFVGPLPWHPRRSAPRCISERRLDSSRPTVYVALGSMGRPEMLHKLGELAQGGCQAIVATGHPLTGNEKTPPGVFLEEFVDTRWVYDPGPDGRPLAQALICHGGNGTLYQALAAGVPVVGFANHLEQLYGLRRVSELGLGRAFRRRDLEKRPDLLVRAIEELLADSGLAGRSAHMAQQLSRWLGAPKRAAQLIHDFLSSQAPLPSIRGRTGMPEVLETPKALAG